MSPIGIKEITYGLLALLLIITASVTDASAAYVSGAARMGSGYAPIYADQEGVVWVLENEPRPVDDLSGVKAVAADTAHYLFINSDGTVWGKGKNSYGQIGDGTVSASVSQPVQAKGLTNVIKVSVGKEHSLALSDDGTIYAWGDNSNGQLGVSGYEISTVPIVVQQLTNVVELSAGEYSSMAITSDGAVWKWGNLQYKPTQISNQIAAKGVAAGDGYWLMLMEDGTVKGWGYNGNGELGDGTNTSRATPVAVTGLDSGQQLVTGFHHSLVLLSDGTVSAWGKNNYGQLGDGTKVDSSLPVRVNGLTDVVAIAAGQHNSLAMTADGSVWMWGEFNGSVVPELVDVPLDSGASDASGKSATLSAGAGKTGPAGTYDGTNAHKSNVGTGIVVGYDISQIYKVRRAQGNNFVHGQFKKNTNACASCHMTHTAAGDSLLIRNGIYNTCTACHDGTIGKLNVFDIPAYDEQVEAANYINVGGGTFGGVVDSVYNASMHRPTGYLLLTAAFGGNRALNADLNGDGVNDSETGSWSGEFTCSSCHQPHGSYSDRLLVPNPANIERQAVTVADWQVIGTNESNTEVWAAVYQGEVIPGPWVNGKNYQKGYIQTVVYQAVHSIDTTVTPMVVDANKTQEEPDYILDKAVHLNDRFSINYAQGIATKKADYTPPPGGLKIAIVPALVVEVDRGLFQGDNDLVEEGAYLVDETADDTPLKNPYIQGLDGSIIRWKGANQTQNRGKNGITWFCAACHTDYYAEKFVASDEGLEGRYTTAYRHTINRSELDSKENPQEQLLVYEYGSYAGEAADVLTCVSCHYAHGTSKQIMRNADDTAADRADVNPSSAIKRYVNMAVCWKCHTEQHNAELINSEGYWNSADVNDIKSSNGGWGFLTGS